MDETNHSREDKWFLENEKHLVEAARAAREKRAAERVALEKEEALRKLKDLHFMKCPKCGHDMKEESVEGVSVDRCTFCEGIYCDAGELEVAFLRRAERGKGLLAKLIGL